MFVDVISIADYSDTSCLCKPLLSVLMCCCYNALPIYIFTICSSDLL